jgi:hypothetical protein
MDIRLTSAQVETTRSKLIAKGQAANAAFRSANPDYADKTQVYDDTQIVKALGSSDSAKLADIRAAYLASGRDLFTVDRLTLKTDEGLEEGAKFVLKPWLFVKQSRSDKIMYQQPKAEALNLNSLLDASGSEHQVLRSKRVFQLASDVEIEAFAADLCISLDLYLQLNF